MAFVKANREKEKKGLEQLVSTDSEAQKAHDEFLARIALQKQLVELRKSEKLTQQDVAQASGLSQQAVSRLETGTGATINSLIKYINSIGYSVVLMKTKL